MRVCLVSLLSSEWGMQLGVRGIPARIVKGLDLDRRLMGIGRAALSLQVTKDEIEVLQWGASGRLGLYLHRKDFLSQWKYPRMEWANKLSW